MGISTKIKPTHANSRKNYYALIETVVDAIISINECGNIVFCNPAARNMFGYEDDLIGKPITMLMPKRYWLAHRMGMNRYLNTGLSEIVGRTVEMTGLKKDGTEFPIEISVSDGADICYFTSIIRDITERKRIERGLLEANKKLKELSIKDSLTNLYNRRYTLNVLEAEFNRAKRYQNPLSCLMIDIDYFKKINDNYGHHFGDRVLVHFSSFLVNMTRSTDIVSRHGGEEFFVILPDVKIDGAKDFAERLREIVSKQTIEDKEKNITTALTISVGVSSFSRHTPDKDEMVNQADSALYEAKRLGRNRVCLYANPDGNV